MKKLFLLTFVFSILFISYVRADYSWEYKQAYTWAYNNKITTMSTIDKANMNWNITRIELAKMISNYAAVTPHPWPAFIHNCDFDDVSSELDKKYDNWVTNVCKAWLMWVWIKNFRPYDKVTIAEFWTILSRFIYWYIYDVNPDSWTPYYEEHLKTLRYAWIMKDISNPMWRYAVRGDVMSMLRKSSVWWNFNDSINAYKADWYKIIYENNNTNKQTVKWDKVLYVSTKYWFSAELWSDVAAFKYNKTYDPFVAYCEFGSDDDEDNSDCYKSSPFDWEQLIDIYDKTDWSRRVMITVYKKDKNAGYPDQFNSKYVISVWVDAWVDYSWYVPRLNVYEL